MFPADFANRSQTADIPAGPRRSLPRHPPGSATGSGPAPIASQTGRLPGRHARSPSKDCRCALESKTDDRSEGRAAALPAPAAIGSQSPSSCRCDRWPARPGRRSEPESWQRFKPTHDPQQRLDVYIAIDNNALAVPDHNLDFDDSPFRCPSQAAPARSPPAQIRQCRQADLRDTPCASQTAAGWKSHAVAPSPMPAAEPKNSPRLSVAFLRPTIDGDDPCQQFQGD